MAQPTAQVKFSPLLSSQLREDSVYSSGKGSGHGSADDSERTQIIAQLRLL
jgi:hypothetical protein